MGLDELAPTGRKARKFYASRAVPIPRRLRLDELIVMIRKSQSPDEVLRMLANFINDDALRRELATWWVVHGKPIRP